MFLSHSPIATAPLENVDHIRVSCPNHIHPEFEAVICTEGFTTVEISGQITRLKAGEIAYIPAFDIHRYIEDSGKCKIFIFRSDTVPAFSDFVRNKKPQKHSFCLKKSVYEYVMSNPSGNYSLLFAQGIMAPICNEIVGNCDFKKSVCFDYDIFYNAILYIGENCTESLTLSEVAKNVGCHPASLSRIFRKNSSVGFCEYVNQMRCRKAIMQIENGVNITEVSFNSGFGSVRNFNRVFKKHIGCTPVEYRKLCIFNDNRIF